MKMQMPKNPEVIEDFIGGIETVIDEISDHGVLVSNTCNEMFKQQKNIFETEGFIEFIADHSAFFLKPNQIHQYLPAFEYKMVEDEVDSMISNSRGEAGVQFFLGIISKNGYDIITELLSYYSDEISEMAIEYNDDFLLIAISDTHQFLFDVKGAIEGLEMYRKEHQS